MYRRLLTYVQTQRARRREPEVREAAFWRQHLGRLLAWPAGALFLLGLGWLILFQQLEAKRRQLELQTLQDAQTLAAGYAEQVVRSMDTIEQTARFVKFEWESRQGEVHLGDADERGLLLHASRLLVYLVDAQGRVLTSSAPTVMSPAAAADILPRLQ